MLDIGARYLTTYDGYADGDLQRIFTEEHTGQLDNPQAKQNHSWLPFPTHSNPEVNLRPIGDNASNQAKLD